MRSTGRKREKFKLKNIILDNIHKNIKEYIVVTAIFLIGIIAGVIVVNNSSENQIIEVTNYINNFTDSLKGEYYINKGELLKDSLIGNLKLAVGMWFIGSTVVGIPIVLGIVLYRGFCIGYTISSVIAVLGTQKGIIFSILALLLQNIIFIPILIALAVSGIKLYQSIMKDKRKENIKLQIIKHTMMSIMLFGLLIISSLIEVYISTNLLTACIQFF